MLKSWRLLSVRPYNDTRLFLDFFSQVGRRAFECGRDSANQHSSDPQAGNNHGGAGQETGHAGQQSDQMERQT